MDSRKWGDNSCPHAEGHTFEYCDGYQNGYTASWNAWTYDMQHGLYPFAYLNQYQQQSQQTQQSCTIIGSPGASCVQQSQQGEG
ncbi:MAG: hypothetical protein WA667_18885 [Candidatus Nitrosopolaris sp.]